MTSLFAFRWVFCHLRGHKRFPNAPWYWHSHERCMRCGVLASSPMVAPKSWNGCW